jgi:exodeoxyribonuclease VII small subunit
MTLEFNFEQAFCRLEAILDRMNGGNVPLEEALNLYEEADGLIRACTVKLHTAESRIETLIKKRDGELLLHEDGKPLTEIFQEQEAIL